MSHSLCWCMRDTKIISVWWIAFRWQRQTTEASNVWSDVYPLWPYHSIYTHTKLKEASIYDSSDLHDPIADSQQTFMHGNTQLSRQDFLPNAAVLQTHLQANNLTSFQGYFWRQDRYIPKAVQDECTGVCIVCIYFPILIQPRTAFLLNRLLPFLF